MLSISQLFIYPVKSLGGIAVQQARLTSRGLEYDRRWMLVDEQNQFLSQRTHPEMALFKLDAADNGFKISYLPDNTSSFIPFLPTTTVEIIVSVWNDKCTARLVSEELDKWFSEKLKFKCRLVYMPETSLRPVDERYAKSQEQVSFADAYPMLLIGQASLDKLNEQLVNKVSIDRFRPNIVFTGAEPHFEDQMGYFTINGIEFGGVKPCARCRMIGIDQQTAVEYKEPTKTLAGYRTKNNAIYFGQNLLHKGQGTIRIGNQIEVLRVKPDFMHIPGKVLFYELV